MARHTEYGILTRMPILHMSKTIVYATPLDVIWEEMSVTHKFLFNVQFVYLKT